MPIIKEMSFAGIRGRFPGAVELFVGPHPARPATMEAEAGSIGSGDQRRGLDLGEIPGALDEAVSGIRQ